MTELTAKEQEQERQRAKAAEDLERREQLFLDYHGGTAWARAKIDSGTLYITEEAETYMRREIEFRNAERDRMEQLRKEDLEHHGHDNEAETRTADSVSRSIVAGTVHGDRSRSRQLYSDHSEQPRRGSGNAPDGVQPGTASYAGDAGGNTAGRSQPAFVETELRPAVGGDSAIPAPAPDQAGDGAQPGKAGKHRATRARKSRKATGQETPPG